MPMLKTEDISVEASSGARSEPIRMRCCAASEATLPARLGDREGRAMPITAERGVASQTARDHRQAESA